MKFLFFILSSLILFAGSSLSESAISEEFEKVVNKAGEGLRGLADSRCDALFEESRACKSAQCQQCTDSLFDQLGTNCTQYATSACRVLTGACPSCDPCRLKMEAAYKCDNQYVCSTRPRLDCNLGIVPVLGELPLIGIIFNLLFGWLINIFN
jgi:hypothetical protein